jgi:hypothetical protein
MTLIEVMPAGKIWGVYIDGELFGTSKHSFACDFAASMIFKFADAAEINRHPEMRGDHDKEKNKIKSS